MTIFSIEASLLWRPRLHPLYQKCREEKNKPGMSKTIGCLLFLSLGVMLLRRARGRGESRVLGYWFLCREGMEAAGPLEIPFVRRVAGACAQVPLSDGLFEVVLMVIPLRVPLSPKGPGGVV